MRFPQRIRTWVLGVGVAVLLIASIFCLRAFKISHDSRMRVRAVSNLKKIGLALHAYHDDWRMFPPAWLPDADGNPQHSWRVLILPYMAQNSLYERYDFNSRWNSPSNRKLVGEIPSAYYSGSGPTGVTHYLAIVGPGTAWPAPDCVSRSDIPDGTLHTISVVEFVDVEVNWMEPRDIPVEEAVRRILRKAKESATRDMPMWAAGPPVLRCDGGVAGLPRDLTESELRGYLTIDGGEQTRKETRRLLSDN